MENIANFNLNKKYRQINFKFLKIHKMNFY